MTAPAYVRLREREWWADPYRYRTRADLCPGMGHPGVTYNDALDRSYCLCGHANYPGETAESKQHIACCGGPLTARVDVCATCGAPEGERHRPGRGCAS